MEPTIIVPLDELSGSEVLDRNSDTEQQAFRELMREVKTSQTTPQRQHSFDASRCRLLQALEADTDFQQIIQLSLPVRGFGIA